MRSNPDAKPEPAEHGDKLAPLPPAIPDTPGNTTSTVIEAPQTAGRKKLDPHDFADGGGSGGAEAFSRKRTGK